jgi:acyl-coenzyme A synthetase/AMP-(fatty) acid ligase
MKQEHDLGLDVNPLAPACLEQGQLISRRQFQHWMASLGQGLRAAGVQQGDLVAMCLSSGAKALALQHSLVARSAITLVLPVRWTAESQLAWLQLKQPQCVVVDNQRLAQLLEAQGMQVRMLEDLINGTGEGPEGRASSLRVYAAHVNTCRLELRAMQAAQGLTARVSCKQWQQWMSEASSQASPQTRWLLGPLHLSMSVASALGVIQGGGVVVFEPVRTAVAWMGLVQSKAISHAFLDSVWLPALLAAVDVPGVALPSLKMLRLLGPSVSPEVLANVRERLTPHVVEATARTSLVMAAAQPVPPVFPAPDKARAEGDELEGIAMRRGAKAVPGESHPLQPEEWLQGVNGKRWLH